ncbi:MAG: hypothetical protein LBJ59_08675 [Zoogloeaceae bacterium]|nr:hypothetical protein [Zoogloeaceae bacterium]
MSKLKVRVNPKSGATRFYRCGFHFTDAWQEVAVDAATARRLTAEQMLAAQAVGDNAPAAPTPDAPGKPKARAKK